MDNLDYNIQLTSKTASLLTVFWPRMISVTALKLSWFSFSPEYQIKNFSSWKERKKTYTSPTIIETSNGNDIRSLNQSLSHNLNPRGTSTYR